MSECQRCKELEAQVVGLESCADELKRRNVGYSRSCHELKRQNADLTARLEKIRRRAKQVNMASPLDMLHDLGELHTFVLEQAWLESPQESKEDEHAPH